MLTIRQAIPQDLDAITEIYNEAIIKTTATFDTNPKTIEEQNSWYENHGNRHPILVAEQDNIIIGWASLSQWSDRRAYSDTAEISLYVKEEYQGKGIGRKLVEAIVQEGKNVGLHTLITRITEGNKISMHLAESVGFKHVGIMKEVGQKFDKLLDVILMQKIYDSR